MNTIEVTLLTSKTFLVIGSILTFIFLNLTLKANYLKKDYSDYYFLMIYSAIIVIMAKFNLFVPII